jgi:hypothetical protein
MIEEEVSKFFDEKPTFETIGGPEGYRHYKVNTNNIRCMRWDPIGKWKKSANGLLVLTSPVCELKVMYMDGWAQEFHFKENDVRYMIGDWIVIFCRDLAKCHPFDPKADPNSL